MAENLEDHDARGNAPDGDTPFDTADTWRKLRDASLDAWAKGWVQAVNTDAYAQATGTVLDAYLTASVPFREALEKSMTQILQQLSIPTRADFENLAERMTHIEMRLDDLDAKLDSVLKVQNMESKPSKKEPA
jgi:hypothetical protein